MLRPGANVSQVARVAEVNANHVSIGVVSIGLVIRQFQNTGRSQVNRRVPIRRRRFLG
jgi:hypothetical protein